MRALLIRHDKLGDLLVSTPAMQSLKEAIPDLHLTVWIQNGLGDVLRFNAYVDSFAYTELKPSRREALSLPGRMRRGKFDKAVFLKNRAGTHLPASFLAGVHERIGSVTRPYKVFLTKNLGLEWHDLHIHEAELCYMICEAAFGVPLRRVPMTFNYPSESDQQVSSILSALGVVGPYFCVHPGTGGTSNVWYPERFGRAAKEIAAETGMTPIFTGTADEAPLVNECLISCPGGHSVVGSTDLFTLAALTNGAALVIASNTGTMHVAASQQTPIVMVEPTPDVQQRWDQWHPWMCPSRFVGATTICDGCDHIDCHKQGHACKDTITTSRVVEAALDLL